MKNPLCLLLIFAFMTSCVKYTTVIDYRPLQDKGLYITADSYQGAQTPMGSFVIKVDSKKDPIPDPLYEKGRTANTHEAVTTTLADRVAEECKKLGANGVSNFKVSRGPKTTVITGLAIKIEK